MKIVIDLTALDDNFTGIERYALNMALALIRKAVSPAQKGDREESECRSETGKILCPELDIVQPDSKRAGCTFELVFKNRVFPDFLSFAENPAIHFHILGGCRKLLFNQWRLPLYLNRLEADFFLFFAFPMPMLLSGKRVFGTIHDMCCWDCPWTMRKMMAWYFRLSYRFMARHAERIITISEFSRSRIMEILKIDREKTFLAYCGISENFRQMERIEKDKSRRTGGAAGEEYRETRRFSEEERRQVREKYGLPDEYYLCLSTLEPRKNMLLLLNTCLRLYQEGKLKTRLVLAGRKGWKIDELLAEAKQDGMVTVTGFIEDGDLPVVYQMARCFVFPSLYEGFGIPPLEAMSQGVPVIASDSSSMPEILGDAAFYFRNNDAQDLERALLEFERESRERIEKKIQAGYERSVDFRYETAAGNLLKICESISSR